MATIAQTTASEALAGLVERVTFHNPENGFCVLRVKARGHRDLVTVVGRAALISAGEFVQMSGIWVNDRTHGQQFRASFLKTSPPTTLEGIERYLASGMIRGIGPIYAKRLVRGFGEAARLPQGALLRPVASRSTPRRNAAWSVRCCNSRRHPSSTHQWTPSPLHVSRPARMPRRSPSR